MQCFPYKEGRERPSLCVCMYDTCNDSLGPRPSPLRDLVRAFNCAGEGNIENGEGLG